MTNHFKSMSLLALPWRDDIAVGEAMASDKVVNSGAADEEDDDALDTELASISFGGGEGTDETVRDSIRAPYVQEFASLLSVANQASNTHQDRLQSLETWTDELKTVSGMLGPEQEPVRPPTPEIQAILTDQSDDEKFEQKDEKEHSSPSGKSITKGGNWISHPIGRRGNFFRTTLMTVQSASKQYEEYFEDLEHLPKEFEQVNRCFPLAMDFLRHTRGNPAWDGSPIEIIQPLAASLEKQAKMLRDVFSNVGKERKKASWDKSVLDCYRDTLIDMGKSYCVEVLMLDLLKDLDALFIYKLLKTDD